MGWLTDTMKKTVAGSIVKPKTMEEREKQALEGKSPNAAPSSQAAGVPEDTGYKPGDIMKKEEELKKSKKGFTKGAGGE